MRILVVHGWVTGNLGDVLQTTVLLEHLRSLAPDRLDLAAWPRIPAAGCAPMLARVDRLLPEVRSRAKPGGGLATIRRALRDVRYVVDRARLFRGYDVIVSAPGPFLSATDPRSRMALLDLRVARSVGRPFILSSHSIGPLDSRALHHLSSADLIVAREPETHEYLSVNGIDSVSAADLAFLFPLRPVREVDCDYRLAFLRSDNLDLERLRLDGGALRVGELELIGPSRARLILATSDPHRDRRSLEAIAARKSGIEIRSCETVSELIELIGGAVEVATDRYHPAVLAAASGKKVSIVETPGWQKMTGLRRLLETLRPDEIRARARSGLERISERVRAASP